jgi:thioredoxin reductase (NADPH)
MVDLVVVGAGPAGLAAAVHAGASGRSTVVVEAATIGGQAVTVSLVRDYPGFPEGVSGLELMQRLYQQAVGLKVAFVQERVVALDQAPGERRVRLGNGEEMRCRTLLVATGAAVRRFGIQAVDKLAGVGVHYGNSVADLAGMTGEDVVVTGGDDAVGQAALALARYATNVTLVLRGALDATLSPALVAAVDRTRNIRVRVNTQVVDGFGESRLEGVVVRHRVSGTTEAVRARALYALLGAEPGSAWLKGLLTQDARGYLVTGPDLGRVGPTGDWPLERAPLLLETSLSGVFAAGDVRHDTVKQISVALIEGAFAGMLATRYLQEMSTVPVAAPR